MSGLRRMSPASPPADARAARCAWSISACSSSFVPARLGDLALEDQPEEPRDEEDREERRGEHAAHDAGANRLTARQRPRRSRSRAASTPRMKREARSIRMGRKPQSRRFDRRPPRSTGPLRAGATRTPTIRIRVSSPPRAEQRDEGRSGSRRRWSCRATRPQRARRTSPNGRREEHGERQRPAFVLRGTGSGTTMITGERKARSPTRRPSAFSWYGRCRPQSKLKSGGSTSAAICSTRAIA